MGMGIRGHVFPLISTVSFARAGEAGEEIAGSITRVIQRMASRQSKGGFVRDRGLGLAVVPNNAQEQFL